MVRFGIIGTNTITEKFVQAVREAAGGAVVAAVYSRTEDRAAAYADKHGIEHRFTSLDAMLQSDAIDAVYIASPNAAHVEQAVRCMDGGKHVMCEKPIASNPRELKRMVEAANRNQVLLMEAMKSTVTPSFAAIMSHLPKLGKIRRYFASYCQYSSRYDAYKQGEIMNAFKPDLSNGALMDIGVYGVYPAVVLFGEPQSVKAEAYMLESGVDGQGSMILSYPDMDAVIMYSKIANSYVPSEIQGENGSMIIDQISEPRKVQIHYRDGRVEEIGAAGQAEQIMTYEVQEFVRVLAEGKRESAINSHRHSLIVQEIMAEARRQFGLVYPADQQ